MSSKEDLDNPQPKATALYLESLRQDRTLIKAYKKLFELNPSHFSEYVKMMGHWNKSD